MKKKPKTPQKKNSDTNRKFPKLEDKKIILKISGEFLGNKDEIFNQSTLQYITEQIAEVQGLGVKIGIVVGGGNIIRGRAASWLEKVTADYCGMMATVINGLVIYCALQKRNIKAQLCSAIEIPSIAKIFSNFDYPRTHKEREILIFVAGTGNPFFTTDTAAALRAVELGADILIKGTKVEGVYSADPVKDPKAILYKKLKFDEVITKGLAVMDLAAFNICRETNIPICVYNFMKYPLKKIISGDAIGTLITNGG